MCLRIVYMFTWCVLHAHRLALTKLDVLDGLERVSVAISYELDGETITTPPALAADLARVRVNYIELTGWTGTTGVRDFDSLPANAKEYITTIERLIEIPGNYINHF